PVRRRDVGAAERAGLGGPALSDGRAGSALSAQLDAAVAAVRERIGPVQPAVGLILGSGLGGFAERLEEAAAVPYQEIPGFAQSTVVGHAGRLVYGRHNGLA